MSGGGKYLYYSTMMHCQWDVLNSAAIYGTRLFIVQTQGILFGKFSSPLIKALCPASNAQIRLDNDKQFGLCGEIINFRLQACHCSASAPQINLY